MADTAVLWRPDGPPAAAGGTDALPLAVRDLIVTYGETPVLRNVSATFRPGRLSAIVGPNGAGKSTLLKAVLGLVPRAGGAVEVFGQPFAAVRHRVAYVPQRASVDWDFPVRVADVVLMGLTRELGLLRPVRARHRDLVRACLERVGLEGLAGRQIGALSGGQQQRVFLARALAQGADLMLLDEPFAGVDAATERAILDVLHALKAEGKAVVVVHHDLATVAETFDDVLLLNVRTVAEGPVRTTLTAEALQATYGGRLAAGQVAGLGAP